MIYNENISVHLLQSIYIDYINTLLYYIVNIKKYFMLFGSGRMYNIVNIKHE